MEDYTNFSYWFTDTITDPNGKNVTDINKGISRLFTDLVSTLNNTTDNTNTQFLINEQMVGQPDAAAFLKYSNDALWWYICLSNNLEDPMTEFKNDKVFYIFEQNTLDDFAVQDAENSNSNNQKSKIGKIVELN